MSTLFFDAFTRIGPRPREHGSHPWSLDHLLAEMQHCSISGALVASTGQTQYDAMLENRRLSARLAGHDHLFAIWNVYPHWTDECPEPEALTAQMAEHDVRAVTLQPLPNGWNLHSRGSEPLLQELERTRTLVILNASEPIDAASIERLAERYPRLPLLLRGMSWARGREVLPLVLHHKNVHLSFDMFQSNLALEWLAERGCAEQLVFASNAPQMSAGAHRAYIDWANLPAATKTQIASGNLTRLLKGLAPPRPVENADEDELMAAARRGEPLPALTLDMHAHMLDEGLNGAGGAYVMFDGGPDGIRRLAERMGVDGMGIMSWDGTVGVHAEQGNRCVTAALDAHPDFYWGLATFDVIHESPEAMRAQMEAVYADKRFLGLKPYPSYGIPYSDPRYDVWWEFGHERKLYAGFHPVNWFQPGEFASVCERFPDLTVVAYHCGASYDIADTAIELAKRFPNFMIEITLTPSCGGIIDYLVAGAGADRVMYGSDLPMRDPRQQLGWVVFSRLSLEQKRRVLGGNAKALLDRIRAAQE